MSDAAGAVVNGLILGSQYGLFAVGLALIIGAMRILNLAHAVLFVAGAYATYVLARELGGSAPVWVVVLLGGLAGGLLAGLLLELVGLAPLRRRGTGDEVTVALLTVGFTEAAVSGIGLVEGTEPKPVELSREVLTRVGTATVTVTGVLSVVTAIALFGALYWVMQRTRLGLQMRTVAASAADGQLIGLNSGRIIRLTVLVAAVLAGIGGALYAAGIGTVDPQIGNDLLVKGAAIVVVGGLGSVAGAVLVAYLIGFAETFTVVFASSDLREVAALALLVAILLFRPRGLFGHRQVQRL
jgi:branched-chain amino acid transport system permease protein